MSLETALRASEILLALALLQAAVEHLWASRVEQIYAVLCLAACLSLLSGAAPVLSLLALLGLSLWALSLFNGPYNGGSDRMGLLVLMCLTLARTAPNLAELAMGYLALQLVLSYAISGWVKIVNPAWRTGHALRDVFLFSAYPVSQNLRNLANRRGLLLAGSWAVILFELAFPFAILNRHLIYAALTVASCFHLANACLFGLNRFVWVWLSAYPVLIWFQGRVF